MQIRLTVGLGTQPDQVEGIAAGHAGIADTHRCIFVVGFKRAAHRLLNDGRRDDCHIPNDIGECALGRQGRRVIQFGQHIRGVGRPHGNCADLGVGHLEFEVVRDVVHGSRLRMDQRFADSRRADPGQLHRIADRKIVASNLDQNGDVFVVQILEGDDPVHGFIDDR